MNDTSSASATTRLRRGGPAAALAGFLILLAVLFGAAYATGAAVGPVAPGLHPTGGSGPGSPGSDGSGSGGMDMGKGH